MRRALPALLCLLAVPALVCGQDALARGDSLREQGDYAGALSAYTSAIAAGGESAAAWKRVAWAQRGLRNFRAAERAFVSALAIDPGDREACDDLDALKRSRGLTVRAWYGGTEPSTSRTAMDGEVWYGGLDRVELGAGGGWTDNIFYTRFKGFVDASWFYSQESYLKASAALRKYDYTGAKRPTPDSSAYRFEPRAELEVSHWFARFLHANLDYQLDLPNFEYDPGTWIMTHKGALEVETLWAGLRVGGTTAVLSHPDPKTTVVAGSPSSLPGARTSVDYQPDFLWGAAVSYDASLWGVGARFISNRDLDSSYEWSVVSSFNLQPISRMTLDFQWVFDHYSADAGAPYTNEFAHVVRGEARFDVLTDLVLGAGAQYVNNPGPASTTDTSARNDVSLLLSLQYKTGLF